MELIKREIEAEILEMASVYPVVTMIGPRQSGKTTTAKYLFPGKPYVSLEDVDERSFASGDPRGFLARFPDGAIFDEIQRLPILLSYIQGVVDSSNKKGLFILTGSHQLELQQAVSQSLAGRTAILHLLPLTIAELFKGGIELSLDQYLLRGMYPRPYKDNINPTKFYRDYVQTYIERDVRQIINVKDLNLFHTFLKLCAGRIGQVFNSHHMSNELGVSYHTIRSWLSVLEASFLVRRLQPYYENFGKRVIKSPKLYFVDVGLASYLLNITNEDQVFRDPLKGSLVENLVVMECIKNRLNRGSEPAFYYYRDNSGKEVDLLYKTGNKLVPIEIKSSMTYNASFSKGIIDFQNISAEKTAPGFVVYSGMQEQQVDLYRVINYKNLAKIFDE